MMKLESMASSHVGRRAHNEDAFCRADALGLCVVADGMGGYEGGEVASELAVGAVQAFFTEHAEDAGLTWPWGVDRQMSFEENKACVAVRLAHRAIMEQRQGKLAQMGSTIALIALADARVVIAHVGDSRVYRLRAGVLERMTIDHSMVEQARLQGIDIDDEVAARYRNLITRALGMPQEDERPELRVELAEPGDLYLLSSDGLHEPLDHDQLRAALIEHGIHAASLLTRAAYEAGGSDNITAVIARVVAA
jgi:PPM family protein phosphatase